MSETVVELHIRAESVLELRDKLSEAMAAFGLPVGVLAPPVGEPTVESVMADAAEVRAQIDAQQAAAEPEKPKRQRRAKAEEAPADAPQGPPASTADTKPADAGTDTVSSTASAAGASPSSTATADPTASTPAVTHEQAKVAAEAFMAGHPDGKDQAKKEIRGYLATYGVSRVAELAAKDLQSFLSDLEGV